METRICTRLIMKTKITTKQLREFGYVVGFGVPFLIGWLIPFFFGHSFRLWTIIFGSPLVILGLINPNLLFYPYKLWIKIGYILGWVNSRIVLGLIFISILFPISIMMRFFNYDPLGLKKQNQKTFRQFKQNHQIDLKRIF